MEQELADGVGHISRKQCKPLLRIIREVRFAEAVPRTGDGIREDWNGVHDLGRADVGFVCQLVPMNFFLINHDYPSYSRSITCLLVYWARGLNSSRSWDDMPLSGRQVIFGGKLAFQVIAKALCFYVLGKVGV